MGMSVAGSRSIQRRARFSAIAIALTIVALGASVFATRASGRPEQLRNRAGSESPASGGAARARRRFPVIGCDDLKYTFLNRYSWRFAPTRYCETGGRLGSLEGIDHAHWRDWGQRQAIARGSLVDGLGFEYPATITAYNLRRCHRCFGMSAYNPSWYLKLHVVAKGGIRGGVPRGPFNVSLDVGPQERPHDALERTSPAWPGSRVP